MILEYIAGTRSYIAIHTDVLLLYSQTLVVNQYVDKVTTLLCLIVGGLYYTFWNFSPLIAFYDDIPILAEYGLVIVSKIFTVAFTPLFLN